MKLVRHSSPSPSLPRSGGGGRKWVRTQWTEGKDRPGKNLPLPAAGEGRGKEQKKRLELSDLYLKQERSSKAIPILQRWLEKSTIPDKKLDILKILIQIEPTNIRWIQNRAEIYESMKNMEYALDDYQALLKINSENKSYNEIKLNGEVVGYAVMMLAVAACVWSRAASVLRAANTVAFGCRSIAAGCVPLLAPYLCGYA